MQNNLLFVISNRMISNFYTDMLAAMNSAFLVLKSRVLIHVLFLNKIMIALFKLIKLLVH